MICLICHEEVENKLYFWDIFLLRKQLNRICQTCQEGFERIGDSHCLRCYKENAGEVCQDCQYWEQQGIEVSHQSLYHYNAAMKSYFQTYKFHGDYLLRQVFGADIRRALKIYKDYTLVPVPVSPETYQERGFNQVEGFLEAAGLHYEDLLTKEEAVKQSHLSRAERLQMKNHYDIKPDIILPEKILLIDDIYTTGATILAIKRFLLAKGAQEVKTFSLCR